MVISSDSHLLTSRTPAACPGTAGATFVDDLSVDPSKPRIEAGNISPTDDGGDPWLILVVDDDPIVHGVTRLALRNLAFGGRPVRLLEAASAIQAKDLLARYPDIALVLLDIAMETAHSGIDLISHIRGELKNSAVRIALRTGADSQLPPEEIVSLYEIESFHNKGDLTFSSVRMMTVSALRTYQLLQKMKRREWELTACNEELERFSYVAAHDLQTPLRLIGGASELLQKNYGNKLDHSAQEVMGIISLGVKNMQALIRDLLDLARIGKADIAPSRLDIANVIDHVCEQMKPLLTERGATVHYDGMPTIEGNASQITQLFMNLFENAIKFQPGSNPSVNVSASRHGSGWELRVTDRGIGMKAEDLHEIFELFRRLHSNDEFPGTGIGLAICKKIVLGHGGTIHAESTPGIGTEMVIRIPERQKRY